MRLRRAQVVPISLSLRTPLSTAHGTLDTRAGFALCLEDEDGLVGWADCLPLDGFGLESPALARRALGEGIETLLAQPIAALDAALDRLETRLPEAPAARAALDLALHDLWARRAGVRVADVLAKSPQDAIGVAALITGSEPQSVAASARSAIREGFRSLKLKVGAHALAEDTARVNAARAAAPLARLRLDANGAWSVGEATRALESFAAAEPEFVEQPLAGDASAFARLRLATGIPLAADESIRDLESVERFLDADAVDVLVLKPAAVGGLRAAARLAARARERGVECVVTSFLDSSLGLAGALELARALPEARFDHGLATDTWLREDLARLPAPCAGRRGPGPECGLGITPEAGLLGTARTGKAESFPA